MRTEVERVDPRGESPGEKLKIQIELGGSQGKTLTNVIPLFDEILLIWQVPDSEQRG